MSALTLAPHPDERGEASRLEGGSRGLRGLGPHTNVPSTGPGQALRGRFAAPQDEQGRGSTLKPDSAA
jgi:hypothetical protein